MMGTCQKDTGAFWMSLYWPNWGQLGIKIIVIVTDYNTLNKTWVTWKCDEKWDNYCGRENSDPPKMSMSYYLEPVNMLPNMAKGTL